MFYNISLMSNSQMSVCHQQCARTKINNKQRQKKKVSDMQDRTEEDPQDQPVAKDDLDRIDFLGQCAANVTEAKATIQDF